MRWRKSCDSQLVQEIGVRERERERRKKSTEHCCVLRLVMVRNAIANISSIGIFSWKKTYDYSEKQPLHIADATHRKSALAPIISFDFETKANSIQFA